MSADRTDSLRDEILEKVRDGRFEEALELSREVLEATHREDDPRAADLAICNHANILVAQNRCGEWIPKLLRVLMQSTDPLIRFLAATAISRHHDHNGQVERGTFYARLALDHAKNQGDAEHLGTAHNNLANLLLVDSLFSEAATHYRSSLAFLKPTACPQRAMIKANLGYCLTILGHLDEAFAELEESLRMIRHVGAGADRFAPQLSHCHLSLAYACLEAERFDDAWSHARRALDLAASSEASKEQHKNALYLCGEAAKHRGDSKTAFDFFDALQRSFYPDEPFVSEVLLSTDVRHLINLMA